MSGNLKTEKSKKVIETCAEFVGAAGSSAVGAIIGSAVAGPGGAVIGSLTGTAIQKTIETIGVEISKRVLSPMEKHRVGTVYADAQQIIAENIEAGKTLREDNFFEKQENGRSDAVEILEGTLFAAQREFEDKKLKLLARMYANIAFTSDISKPIANYLIKLAERLTYRQILILRAIGFAQQAKPRMPLKQGPYYTVSGIENTAIATEIYDLYRAGILHSSNVILDCAGINPSALSVGGYGAHLFNLMELNKNIWDGGDDVVMQGEILSFLMDSELQVMNHSNSNVN